MSTLKNLGIKLAGVTIAAGMAAGAAFGLTGAVLTVNLPQPVTVGSSVLPSGEYNVTQVGMNDGTSLFVFRSDNGKEAISAMATKSADPAPDQKTSVVLDNQNGTLHLDKMFIAGDSAGYQFGTK
ncbi:MAG TPA: hypothetical protein VHC90_23585 [Bryobacteraceae bacterium]|nr:hypothetical protein [Bryobacteraceae bacterium]